ncbi:isomerase [Planctomycetota bacterium]|nr:isomerase [Planctomycetota bacterium]
MKYGMNLLLYTDDACADSQIATIAGLKRIGFDGVEVPVFDLRTERYAALGKRLDDLGLERTAVTVSDADHDPISPDPAVRAKAVERLKRVIDCCAAANIGLLVGPYYAALGKFSGSGPTTQEWHHGVEAIRAITAHAAAAKVRLSLEFLNRFEIYLLNTAADSARFVGDIGSPGVGVLYDTFHANIEEKDPAKAIAACAAVLNHVHVSESDRSTPGTGQVAWQATFAALRRANYDGWLTIEAFGQLLPSLAAATKIWRKMYANEEQLARDGLAFIKAGWQRQAVSAEAR